MDHVTYQIQGQTARIVLNRPEKRNALNRAMISELAEIFRELAKDTTLRSVVISGNGPDFCAGADLTEMPDRPPDVKRADINRANSLMDYIEKFPVPVTAEIHGHALGGGLELALACHKRVSGESGFFGFPETTLGLVPSWGGPERLSKLIGKDLTDRMVQTGIRINAAQALEWGIINEIGQLNFYGSNHPQPVEERMLKI